MSDGIRLPRTLEAIRYDVLSGKLSILNQRRLPQESVYVDIQSVQDGWNAIHDMQVRGAPAIAVVGCLSLAVELKALPVESMTCDALGDWVAAKLDFLTSARPTAVNMSKAAVELNGLMSNWRREDGISCETLRSRLVSKIGLMLVADLADNRKIGDNGAKAIIDFYSAPPDGVLLPDNSCDDNKTIRRSLDRFRILTHCNTGSLATSGFGTALGVIRRLRKLGKIEHVYCTETRPYNQGSRLTAYELVYEEIPSTLICDSAVGALMSDPVRRPHAVVVGADRVTLNGDTANKIGTYQLAILAGHHGIPFFVAVPVSSVDPSLSTGEEIVIEERSAEEVTHTAQRRIAAEGIEVWNPAFDVTPASLITKIITEVGSLRPEQLQHTLATLKDSRGD